MTKRYEPSTDTFFCRNECKIKISSVIRPQQIAITPEKMFSWQFYTTVPRKQACLEKKTWARSASYAAVIRERRGDGMGMEMGVEYVQVKQPRRIPPPCHTEKRNRAQENAAAPKQNLLYDKFEVDLCGKSNDTDRSKTLEARAKIYPKKIILGKTRFFPRVFKEGGTTENMLISPLLLAAPASLESLLPPPPLVSFSSFRRHKSVSLRWWSGREVRKN